MNKDTLFEIVQHLDKISDIVTLCNASKTFQTYCQNDLSLKKYHLYLAAKKINNKVELVQKVKKQNPQNRIEIDYTKKTVSTFLAGSQKVIEEIRKEKIEKYALILRSVDKIGAEVVKEYYSNAEMTVRMDVSSYFLNLIITNCTSKTMTDALFWAIDNDYS